MESVNVKTPYLALQLVACSCLKRPSGSRACDSSDGYDSHADGQLRLQTSGQTVNLRALLSVRCLAVKYLPPVCALYVCLIETAHYCAPEYAAQQACDGLGA